MCVCVCVRAHASDCVHMHVRCLSRVCAASTVASILICVSINPLSCTHAHRPPFHTHTHTQAIPYTLFGPFGRRIEHTAIPIHVTYYICTQIVPLCVRCGCVTLPPPYCGRKKGSTQCAGRAAARSRAQPTLPHTAVCTGGARAAAAVSAPHSHLSVCACECVRARAHSACFACCNMT